MDEEEPVSQGAEVVGAGPPVSIVDASTVYAVIREGRTMRYSHVVLSDHCDPNGRRVWKCTRCGTQSLWTDDWLECGFEGAIEAVYCSKACLKADEAERAG